MGVVGEVCLATVNIASQIYGTLSPQSEAVKDLRSDLQSSKWSEFSKPELLTTQCQGMLRAIASDLRGGRLKSLRLEYQGQILADFVNLAKVALDTFRRKIREVRKAASVGQATHQKLVEW